MPEKNEELVKTQVEFFMNQAAYTNKEWEEKITPFIAKIEAEGGYITAAEPIYGRIPIIGRRFTVEHRRKKDASE